jgi:hypothetical protein
MDEKKLRKFAGLSEERLDEKVRAPGVWAAMEQLVADGKRDKKFMLSAISLALDEFGQRDAEKALDFLDLIDQIWQEGQ